MERLRLSKIGLEEFLQSCCGMVRRDRTIQKSYSLLKFGCFDSLKIRKLYVMALSSLLSVLRILQEQDLDLIACIIGAIVEAIEDFQDVGSVICRY